MLSCSHYDQLELLCLYRYPARLLCKRQQQNSHHAKKNIHRRRHCRGYTKKC
ncbi:Rho-binding antiterminator [Vibrio methylphosphonaticus]|uniref:Rho-binding antiterminator n=1 Tax=Vibrio methylphosphonaticus TaxID=2946866 RepID=UPI003872AA08